MKSLLLAALVAAGLACSASTADAQLLRRRATTYSSYPTYSYPTYSSSTYGYPTYSYPTYSYPTYSYSVPSYYNSGVVTSSYTPYTTSSGVITSGYTPTYSSYYSSPSYYSYPSSYSSPSYSYPSGVYWGGRRLWGW